MTDTRIKALDGFRAVAILGVLWAHTWMFLGNPSYRFVGINIAGILSFFGTGVDLFFVISGFCMYVMFTTRSNQSIDLKYSATYLKKRWLRIAPAFYVAIVVYGLLVVNFKINLFDFKYAAKNALFIRTFFKEDTQYAPHFWSLCTEGHFYVVLPLLLLGITKLSFNRCILIVISLCLLCRFFFWLNPQDEFNIINYSIPNRLIEFVAGIMAGKNYVDDNRKWYSSSLMGLLMGGLLALLGRFLLSGAWHDSDGLKGIMARVFDLPLLSIGYGLVINNTLQYRSWLSKLMETKFMTYVGKISYSMYLWHWMVAGFLCLWLKHKFHVNPFLEVNVIFILSVIVLLPISKVSYWALESFYFKKRKIVPENILPL